MYFRTIEKTKIQSQLTLPPPPSSIACQTAPLSLRWTIKHWTKGWVLVVLVMEDQPHKNISKKNARINTTFKVIRASICTLWSILRHLEEYQHVLPAYSCIFLYNHQHLPMPRDVCGLQNPFVQHAAPWETKEESIRKHSISLNVLERGQKYSGVTSQDETSWHDETRCNTTTHDATRWPHCSYRYSNRRRST